MVINRNDIHLNPTDLRFSVLSSEDARHLSVVRIVTSLCFDALGHPLPGGLYDPAMGPFGKSADPCTTCLSTNACTGHFGHIELNALVYNPFFTKTLYEILKISCLNCFRLQFSEHLEKILQLQLNLIDAGYIIEAQNLEVYKSEFVAGSEQSVKTESGLSLHPKIAEMYELLKKGSKNFTNVTKTTGSVRAAIVKSSLQDLNNKKCIYCHETLKKVRTSYNKLVIGYTKAEMEAFYERNKNESGNLVGANNKLVLADECRKYLRNIYGNSPEFLLNLYPVLKNCSKNVEYPVDVFFMNVVSVIPPVARPANVLRGEILEHPRTIVYRNIIEANSVVRLTINKLKSNSEELSEEAEAVYNNANGSTPYEKMYNAWQELQIFIDQILDVNLGREKKNTLGLKQILEKKEGLIRKHMMGKRVNYAARTVITPDPNINVDELGVPDVFARKLSYPVPVTPWNVTELRKMVMNGPNIHPGANYVEDEKGHKILIPGGDPVKRESLAKLLLTNPEDGVKTVHRHLRNGDILLLNRQPTLHKPSIMAHKARILQGEKTYRLHYSNCKAYNADFDGDEMNAHFPQNEVGRSEAYNLVNVSNQYLVPKDGTPLGGLIQDHVISGVKLSIRGRFFNKEDYQQLVFQGLSHLRGSIKLLPPAILKPLPLWSGKQILSTIIINLIPRGIPAVNLTSSAKINMKAWQTHNRHNWICGGTPLKGLDMTESEVIIRKGELLTGVLDKTHYGATPYGLVHCMYELYGGDCSTQLLTSFAKLFTTFLQREGFTLGVHDILVTAEADKKRKSIIRDCRLIGPMVATSALDLPEDTPFEEISQKITEAYSKDPKFRIILDRKYKSFLDEFTNEINQTCVPAGLISKFPQNNLQLMVLSGAKGSTVNTMQISCLLGQIELEGKRPPLMISGKSLPSFSSFETSPKSGGFIDGRFMTGIQPQDFFFHCMAGREGLIDTAVKTSRSGYLQRCLIKHLEGLNVNYDLTVRDSDNSIVQFMYGEDGMDIAKSRFFNPRSLRFLDDNSDVILHASQTDQIYKDDEITNGIQKCVKKLNSWKKKNGDPKQKRRFSCFQQFSADLRNEIEVTGPNKLKKNTGRLQKDEELIKMWKKAKDETKKLYSKKNSRCPDPVVSKYKPDNNYGAISEYLDDLMKLYFKDKPHRKSEFSNAIYVKSMKSLAAPGEPVGLLAAQSIGEPSTQMTLNTFHFAGRGEMNVTLGIPRLREILMLASANIKTPLMAIPFKTNKEKSAQKLRIKLNRVTLADVLEDINVKICLILRPQRSYQYTTLFKFLPRDAYEDDFCVKPKQILKYMNEKFFKQLFRAIVKSAKHKHTVVEFEAEGGKKSKKSTETEYHEADDEHDKGENSKDNRPIDVDDSSDDEGNVNDEDDATAVKLKSKQQDENDYEDPEGEEEMMDANADDILDEDLEQEGNENDENITDEDLTSIKLNEMVNDYEYDTQHHSWCKLTFNLSMKYKNIDISNILKEVAKKSVIYEVDHIKRAIICMQNDTLMLNTDGINIVQMFNYNKLLDLNRLYSNDIHAIARTYGIEAASRVIVKEVQNVFKAYGITVDPRHLLLVADYMTFDGTFKPLSRKGMEFCSSPLQQMSFESCLQFLKSATVNGRQDDLNSPSSRLMVGLPVKSGTGAFSLLTEYNLC